jgi:hypothetical protein
VGGFVKSLTHILIKDTKTLYPTEGFFMDLGEKFTGMKCITPVMFPPCAGAAL